MEKRHKEIKNAEEISEEGKKRNQKWQIEIKQNKVNRNIRQSKTGNKGKQNKKCEYKLWILVFRVENK